MKEKSDFEVMSEMCKSNKDIKAAYEVIEMKSNKKGGKITFGIDNESYSRLSKGFGLGNPTHYTVCYVINKEQFDKLKKI